MSSGEYPYLHKYEEKTRKELRKRKKVKVNGSLQSYHAWLHGLSTAQSQG